VSGAQVWWADLADVRSHHVDLLDPVERARRARYVKPADRDRFTLAVAVTRLVLGERLGLSPDRVPLDRSCRRCGAPHDRPRIADHDSRLRISISHSGSRVAVAVTTGGDIGVDVEQLGARIGLASLTESVLTTEEAAELRRIPSGEQDAGFLAYWTRKEAILKASGEGLRVAPDQLAVSPPDQPPRLLAWPRRPEMHGRIAMWALQPGPGYVACLALIDHPNAEVLELSAPA
jgi:4'-phosphopantetheinyl transferase